MSGKKYTIVFGDVDRDDDLTIGELDRIPPMIIALSDRRPTWIKRTNVTSK